MKSSSLLFLGLGGLILTLAAVEANQWGLQKFQRPPASGFLLEQGKIGHGVDGGMTDARIKRSAPISSQLQRKGGGYGLMLERGQKWGGLIEARIKRSPPMASQLQRKGGGYGLMLERGQKWGGLIEARIKRSPPMASQFQGGRAGGGGGGGGGGGAGGAGVVEGGRELLRIRRSASKASQFQRGGGGLGLMLVRGGYGGGLTEARIKRRVKPIPKRRRWCGHD